MFPGSYAGEEEREPGTHCLLICQVLLVTWILLHCTKFTDNSVYLLKGCRNLYSLWDTYMGGFEDRNNIALMVMVCIVSFEVISELQRKRLRQSCAASLGWNRQTHGQFLQVSTFVAPSLSSTQSMISDTFMWEKSGCFAEVSVMEQTLWKFPNFQENWACAISVYQAPTSLPTHGSLGTWLIGTI